jgi:hypothetical protein
MCSTSLPDPNEISRRLEGLIEIDLPFVWLHPTCYFEGKQEIVRSTIQQLRREEEQIKGEVVSHLTQATQRDQRVELPNDAFGDFSKWVELVVEATESASVSLSQVRAFETCLEAMYRQWCRDCSTSTLNAEQARDFQHWINGIVEAVTDLEQGPSIEHRGV